MTFSDLFKVTIIQTSNNFKNGTIDSCTYNGRPIESRIRSIERRHLMTLNDSYTEFQGHAIFDAEHLKNGTTYRHSVIEILIGTYTRLTQQCHFEWPWVTLSDLAKYSMTRSVARSICVSWASCLYSTRNKISEFYKISPVLTKITCRPYAKDYPVLWTVYIGVQSVPIKSDPLRFVINISTTANFV